MTPISERLLEKSELTSDGCCEWQAATRSGYGVLTVNGRRVAAHRLACEIAHGPAPADKPWALHHCDNRACIAGEHLYWGDREDNTRDAVARGRMINTRTYVTYCIHGHEFTEENTYIRPNGSRTCKECHRKVNRESERTRRARLRDA